MDVVEKTKLIRELKDQIARLEIQIRQVAKTSEEMSNDLPYTVLACEVKDVSGNFLLTPLLIAKAQSYAALVKLEAIPGEWSQPETWRDVPVTFGELSDILRTMHIGVNAGVGYTSAKWKESIEQTALLKLNRSEDD